MNMDNLTDFLLNDTSNITQTDDHDSSNKWAYVPFYIAFVILTIFAIIFNIVTIIVIIRHKSLHTTTSYFLFSLAITDLIVALSNPMTRAGLLICSYHDMDCETLSWHNFNWLTRMADFGIITSSLTITLFTVERYMAICHPLYFLKWSQKKRVLQYIAIVWAFSLVLNIFYHFVEFSDSVNSLIVYLHFLVPFVTITILCILMIYNIKKSKMVPGKSSKDNKSSEKPLQILVAIIITFFMCWSPFSFNEFLNFYFEFNNEYFVLMALFFLSLTTILNPLIYSVFSTKFRKALLESFKRGNANVSSHEDSGPNTASQQTIFTIEMK